MRVLLYEPGANGHREVIWRYVDGILRRAGWQVFSLRVPVTGPWGEMDALQQIARDHSCTIIHVLTGDGRPRTWLTELVRGALRPVYAKVIVTYYLYDNLHRKIRALGWDMLRYCNVIDTLLVSDDYLDRRKYPFWRRRYVSFLPDPWCPVEFEPLSKVAACEKLCVSPSKMRFLVFGDISSRKGLDIVTEAFLRFSDPCVELLVAGRFDRSSVGSRTLVQIGALVESGRAVLRTGYIPEADVSTYFSASDFVVCAYPATFSVSSGTFTRGCAAGKPALVPSHGVLFETVTENDCGVVFKTSSPSSLVEALRTAVALTGTERYSRMSEAARAVAEKRTLSRYAEHLMHAYALEQ
jgi:glycosyltransferase involved in cell wall biosynthesis